MKRYLVFAGIRYESSGGWNEFYSAHDSFREACEAAKASLLGRSEDGYDKDWSHIVDLEMLEIVTEFE